LHELMTNAKHEKGNIKKSIEVPDSKSIMEFASILEEFKILKVVMTTKPLKWEHIPPPVAAKFISVNSRSSILTPIRSDPPTLTEPNKAPSNLTEP